MRSLANRYILDSSSIIDLFRWYPPEVVYFQLIWDKIETIAKSGTLISHRDVYKEIEKGNDKARDWCKAHKDMFLDYDTDQITVMKQVKEVYTKDYWENQNTKPDTVWADPWLVALAITLKTRTLKMRWPSYVVKIVTQESKNKENRIPKIAQNFGIDSINLLEFFREI